MANRPAPEMVKKAHLTKGRALIEGGDLERRTGGVRWLGAHDRQQNSWKAEIKGGPRRPEKLGRMVGPGRRKEEAKRSGK